MEPSNKLRRDILQNVLIVLLTVTAFLQLYLLLRPADSGAGRRQTVPIPETVTELTAVPTPLRLAVTGAYGRYGDLAMTTTDEDFAGPGSLLREALGSAGSFQDCRESDFRSALTAVSVYYDFENVLPLSVAAELVGADAPPAELAVRRLVLAIGEDGVELYLTDGILYHRCATKVAPASLEDLVGSYQPGGAAFAFELGETALDPYTLLPTEELPEYLEFSVQDTAGSADELLSAVGFNPSTKDRYTASNGTQVIGEGERTLRIQPDGTVDYDGGADEALSISAAGQTATAGEAVLGSYQFLYRLLSSGGALALQSVEPAAEDDWLLTFDYQVNGVPVRLSGGEPAAVVEIHGLQIVRFTLHPRQYLPMADTSRLLPLTQALAIARTYAGRELNICYTDTGAGTITAGWLAE